MDQNPPPFPVQQQQCDPAQLERAKSKRVAAGVTGILLGALGVHKFVLGYPLAGGIMLGVTCVGAVAGFGFSFCFCMPLPFAIPTVMYIIGLIEGILYLTKSDEEFCRSYVMNRREWF